jgi:hypothetical protein
MLALVQAAAFDEEGMFRALSACGARALLIGRRALVALGLPVLTADYDFWLHLDDIEALNAALQPFDLMPNRSPDEARKVGRYVLENDERVDVFVARQATTRDGVALRFDDAWARRKELAYSEDVRIVMPCLDDLVLTKRSSMRPRDIDDLELLDKLRRGGGEP